MWFHRSHELLGGIGKNFSCWLQRYKKMSLNASFFPVFFMFFEENNVFFVESSMFFVESSMFFVESSMFFRWNTYAFRRKICYFRCFVAIKWWFVAIKDSIITTLKRLIYRCLSRSVVIVVLNSEKHFHIKMLLASFIILS